MRVDDPVSINLEGVAVIRLASFAKGLAVKRLVETIRHLKEVKVKVRVKGGTKGKEGNESEVNGPAGE